MKLPLPDKSYGWSNGERAICAAFFYGLWTAYFLWPLWTIREANHCFLLQAFGATSATTRLRAIKRGIGSSWLLDGFERCFDSGKLSPSSGSAVCWPCWPSCCEETCPVRLSRCAWPKPDWILQRYLWSCCDGWGVSVGILSYSRSQETIWNTLTFVQEICDRTDVMIPVVIAPRPLRRNCRHRTDWSKSDFLWWLLQDRKCLQVCFLEDRGDIVQECCHGVGSTNLRVILCTKEQGLGHAIRDLWPSEKFAKTEDLWWGVHFYVWCDPWHFCFHFPVHDSWVQTSLCRTLYARFLKTNRFILGTPPIYS